MSCRLLPVGVESAGFEDDATATLHLPVGSVDGWLTPPPDPIGERA